MVEGVERIRFEGEPQPLVNLEALADADVEVVDARLVIGVAAGISIGAEGGPVKQPMLRRSNFAKTPV